MACSAIAFRFGNKEDHESKIILAVLLLVMTDSASAGFKMHGQGVDSTWNRRVDSAQASTPKQDIHREYLRNVRPCFRSRRRM